MSRNRQIAIFTSNCALVHTLVLITLLLYHSSPMIMVFFFLSLYGVIKIRIMTYFTHDFVFHIQANWGGNFKLALGADVMVNI